MATYISFTVFIFILLQFPCNFAYTFNSNEIRDLEGDSSCFISEIASWTASRTKTSIKYSICDGKYLLGGYDILGTLSSPTWYEDNFRRAYSSLPSSHTMIYFAITVYALDSWGDGPNANDTFAIDFDTKRVTGPLLQYTNFPTDICAREGYNDLGPIRVFGRVLHTGTTLTLRLVTMLDDDSSNESVGFRDVTLLFSSTTTTETSCSRASLSFTGNCPCPQGTFLYSPNNCVACHPNCAECFGLLASQCYQCAPGSSWVSGQCVNCDASCRVCRGASTTQCTACSPGLFLFTSNQCIPECPPPFTQVLNVCGNRCNAPCSTTDFLFANNSCLPTCPYPLQTTTIYSTVKKCLNPCSFGEYLYWDGTCKSSCIAPLKIRSESGADYCDYSCPTNQYLYWTGGCAATCAPPLVQSFDKSRQFCVYPCSSQEYLFYNGSCQAYCPLPYINSTSNSKYFCDHPCSDPSQYIYWDNTCQSSCPQPLRAFVTGDLKYCTKSCPNNQFLFWNDTCIDSCDHPLRIVNENQILRCLYPCSSPLEFYEEGTGSCKTACESQPTNVNGLYLICPPSRSSLLVELLLEAPSKSGTPSFILLTKLTQHVKYINATFSPRLQGIVVSKGRSILSLRLGVPMPNYIQQYFEKLAIPEVFERTNLHSSFLVNYFQELTSILIVFALLLFNILVASLAKKYNWNRIENFMNKVRFIPKWNYLLIIFATGLDDIILFSALELQTFKGDSILAIVSFGVCLFMLVVAVGMLVIFYLFASKAQSARVETQTNRLLTAYKLFVIKWQSYHVLFRGFNTEDQFNYLFFFFYTIRMSFPSIIFASSSSTPIMQVIVYLLISVIMIAYILYTKPVVDKINYIQLLLTEVIVLVINICLLVLAAQDPTTTIQSDTIIFLGDAIILGNVCLNILTVVFLVIKLNFQVKEALMIRKQRPEDENNAWRKLIFIFVQQGGMGFEQAEYFDFVNKNPTAVHSIGSLAGHASQENKNADDQILLENEIQIEGYKLTQNMNEEIVMFMNSDNSTLKAEEIMTTSQINLREETVINEQNQRFRDPLDEPVERNLTEEFDRSQR